MQPHRRLRGARRHASAGLTALLLHLYPVLVTVLPAPRGCQRLSGRKLPAVTLVLAALFFGEAAGGWQLAGGALVLGTAVVLVRSPVVPERRVG